MKLELADVLRADFYAQIVEVQYFIDRNHKLNGLNFDT
jgi:hypothetical protein